MENNAYGVGRRGAKTLVAGIFATVIMASGNAALAAGGGSTISGNSVFSDCGAAGSDFALLFSGDLEGCLSIFVQGYTCKELNGFAHYIERGREAFVGSWRGKNGRFATKYVVDAAYASGFCESLDYTLELSGSCTHHVQGRSGVFANTEGVFTLFDVITNVTGDPVTGTFAAGAGANNFLYSGRIQKVDALGGAPAAFEDAAPLAFRSALTVDAAARKARSRRSC